MKKNHIPVADYLGQQIALSGVPQKEIAEALQYDKPNIITMFKQGKTKIPLNKIAPLAKILGIDQLHLLRMAMLEYSPETWSVLESMLGQRMVTDNEYGILEMIRAATNGRDIGPQTDDQKTELLRLVKSWADADLAKAEAAVEALKKRKTDPKKAD